MSGNDRQRDLREKRRCAWGNKRRKGKRAFAAFAALLCLFLPVRAQAEGELLKRDQDAQQEVNYKTGTVRLGEFSVERNTSGSPYYPLTYELKYERSGAKFVEYKVSVKDTVKAGDVLAEFEMEDNDVEIARLKIALERAQEEMERGIGERTAKIDRAKKEMDLLEEGTERELRELELQYLEVELERYRYGQEYSLERQREQLEEAEEEQRDNVLIAPSDGVITDLAYKRQGSAVSPNEVLVVMHSEEGMMLQIDNTGLYFRYNMPVTVTVGNNKNQVDLSGRIVAADDLIDGQPSGKALIALDPYDPDTRLLNPKVAGQNVYLDNVLTVPRNGFDQEEGKYFVTKLVDGMTQKRYITLSGIRSTEDVWVTQGVSEGETLIID